MDVILVNHGLRHALRAARDDPPAKEFEVDGQPAVIARALSATTTPQVSAMAPYCAAADGGSRRSAERCSPTA
jgi:hypothetical protein